MAESKVSSAGAGGGSTATAAAAAGEKPICAICYGDLCALSELIQSIPVCGHVFHELCLQHWIDYCPAGKDPTCPVCKQGYNNNPPTRLYFQSTGNNDTIINNNNNSNNNNNNSTSNNNNNESSNSQNSEAPLLPQGAVIRMELRISALDARVQDVDFKVNRLYRESAERELALLVEIDKQEKLHNTKITELGKKTNECIKLKEKNSQISKELSGLKSDNKKLTTRCSILSRSETRTEKKLNLARDQIKKLKEKVEELERGIKKRKIEISSEKDEKNEKDLKNKKRKNEAFNAVRSIIKTRSMSLKKDLVSDEGDKKLSKKRREDMKREKNIIMKN